MTLTEKMTVMFPQHIKVTQIHNKYIIGMYKKPRNTFCPIVESMMIELHIIRVMMHISTSGLKSSTSISYNMRELRQFTNIGGRYKPKMGVLGAK